MTPVFRTTPPDAAAYACSTCVVAHICVDSAACITPCRHDTLMLLHVQAAAGDAIAAAVVRFSHHTRRVCLTPLRCLQIFRYAFRATPICRYRHAVVSFTACRRLPPD